MSAAFAGCSLNGRYPNTLQAFIALAAPHLAWCSETRSGTSMLVEGLRTRLTNELECWMALVGLVRVSTKSQETARQHDALDPICVKVFEEKLSGKLRTEDRPSLTAAIEYLREGDMLTVQEVDRLGRNLLEGLIVLNDLFQRGIAVKVLEGIAAGEHNERSFVLDMALALAEDRRRDIARKTRSGLDSARSRGRVGGRPTVVDEDKRRAILARRSERESLRAIAVGTKVSLAVVHRVVSQADAVVPEIS
jgi:DNA invertase Pin-like site-specific DNA recombinase